MIAACPFPAGRGSQLLIERSVLGLLGRGHRVDLLAPRFGEPGRQTSLGVFRAGLPRLGRGVSSRPHPLRLLDDALLLLAALRHARARPDVMIGHNVEGGLIAGLVGRLLGLPAVYVRHSDFGEELSLHGPLRRTARRIGRTLEGFVTRLATRCVALAPGATLGDACDVIPPPLDPLECRVEPAAGRTLYFEGNLDPYQNPSWLAAALEAAREVDPKASLLRARGPGARPLAADLALLPRSLAGGFPMKLLAYQIAGIPAVCVESGASGQQDGLDAFVVPGSGSPEAFARRVREALASPGALRSLRESARARALERHDPRRVAALLEESLMRALGRS